MVNWVLFPSPAREASVNARRLSGADAVGLEGRGLRFSPPAAGIGSVPQSTDRSRGFSLELCPPAPTATRTPAPSNTHAPPWFWGAGWLCPWEEASPPGLFASRARLR